MTLSTIIILFFRHKASMQERLLIKEQMGILTFRDFRGFIFDILKAVLVFEAVGATLLFIYFLSNGFPIMSAVWHSIFHAVSAFCNAGFSTFSSNLRTLSNSVFAPLVIAFLFISGGLGFLVWSDIYRTRIKREKFRLSLHSQVVIFLTFLLLLLGTVSFFLLEYENGLKGYPLVNKIVISFFSAATPRTAGFNLIPVDSLLPASLILIMLFMFIGASPGGTGGGIKTTTFLVAILYPLANLKNLSLRIFKRRVRSAVTEKGITIFILSILLICAAVFFITLSNRDIELMRGLFEVFSAFGTVGLSIGSRIKRTLSASYDFSSFGKLVIIIVMFLGRVGVINLLKVAIREKVKRYEYPEDEISIG